MHPTKKLLMQTQCSMVFYFPFNSVFAEMTQITVVPMPGLAWHCEYTSLQVKVEDLVHKVLTIVALLVNISTRKKKKDQRRINVYFELH